MPTEDEIAARKACASLDAELHNNNVRVSAAYTLGSDDYSFGSPSTKNEWFCAVYTDLIDTSFVPKTWEGFEVRVRTFTYKQFADIKAKLDANEKAP